MNPAPPPRRRSNVQPCPNSVRNAGRPARGEARLGGGEAPRDLLRLPATPQESRRIIFRITVLFLQNHGEEFSEGLSGPGSAIRPKSSLMDAISLRDRPQGVQGPSPADHSAPPLSGLGLHCGKDDEPWSGRDGSSLRSVQIFRPVRRKSGEISSL